MGDWREDFVALTEEIEEATGADSVDTIETHYDDGGVTATYWCVFPGCQYGRKDSVAMWLHVHAGPKHPITPNMARWADQIAAARLALSARPNESAPPVGAPSEGATDVVGRTDEGATDA